MAIKPTPSHHFSPRQRITIRPNQDKRAIELSSNPALSSDMQPLQRNCHYGHFRFQLSADPGDAIICACALCTKLGCLWLRATPDTFTVTREDGSLAEYQGTKFCGKCGTAVTAEHPDGPLQSQFLVNARALWEFDPFKIVSVLVMIQPGTEVVI
jgi:hypothetical protein